MIYLIGRSGRLLIQWVSSRHVESRFALRAHDQLTLTLTLTLTLALTLTQTFLGDLYLDPVVREGSRSICPSRMLRLEINTHK